MGVNPGDYRAMMLLLESIKEKKTIEEPPKKEMIKETSSTEVVSTKESDTVTSCEHIIIYK